jgi:general secretion pathway protein F
VEIYGFSVLDSGCAMSFSSYAYTWLGLKPESAEKRVIHDEIGFYSEILSLMKAGFSVPEALIVMSQSGQNSEIPLVARDLLQRIDRGLLLSAAMEQSIYRFPFLLLASVQSSERDGRIEHALANFVALTEANNASKRKITTACIYPAAVTVVGLAVSLFLVLFVLPRFGTLVTQSGRKLSQISTYLISFSQFVSENRTLMLTCALVLIVASASMLANPQTQNRLVSYVLSKRPLRHLYEKYQLTQFFQSLSALKRGGFTIPESLKIASIHLRLSELKIRSEIAHQLIDGGSPVSESFGIAGLADVTTERIIGASERGGDLENAFSIIAARFQIELEKRVANLIAFIEPLLLLAIAMLIGGLVLTMYLPIVEIAAGR